MLEKLFIKILSSTNNNQFSISSEMLNLLGCSKEDFEMFSWMGDVQIARRMIIKASKKFKIKVIEGGYRPSTSIKHNGLALVKSIIVISIILSS